MNKLREVYVVVSEKDICGDIPSTMVETWENNGRRLEDLYNYGVYIITEKRKAAVAWRNKNSPNAKVVKGFLTIKT